MRKFFERHMVKRLLIDGVGGITLTLLSIGGRVPEEFLSNPWSVIWVGAVLFLAGMFAVMFDMTFFDKPEERWTRSTVLRLVFSLVTVGVFLFACVYSLYALDYVKSSGGNLPSVGLVMNSLDRGRSVLLYFIFFGVVFTGIGREWFPPVSDTSERTAA